MARHGWDRLRAAAQRGAATALVVDVAMGVVFLGLLIVERLAVAPVPPARIPATLALDTVIATCLALRRRAPLAAYALGTTALAVEALAGISSALSPYANQIGVYSIGLYATPRRARLGLAIMVAGVAFYFGAAAGPLNLAEPAGVLFVWLLAWGIGYSNARRRDEQRAARRLMRQQAVGDERARIARELHDLIGHTVNVMLVQAGAARRVLDRNPKQTGELLAGLEQTGRDALTELDRVLGVLRRDSPDSLTDGQESMPGLVNLPGLARRMTEAGIRVSIRLDPDLSPLPRSLDLSAYRIVQEALTNALKHGEAGSASVVVRHDGRALVIEVRDDGRGAPPGYAPGRGLLGIGERVALFGGGVEHGAGERGGFRLRAQLPLPGRPAE